MGFELVEPVIVAGVLRVGVGHGYQMGHIDFLLSNLIFSTDELEIFHVGFC